MRIPLIGTKDASSPESRVYPALDSSARIVFDEADGMPSVHTVHAIRCMDILPTGKSEFPFWLDGVYDNWEVFVTNQRIAVRNPFTMSLFRKPKEKAGKVSVGHIYYRSIMNLSAFFSDKNNPILICCCLRKDGTKSSFAIEGLNIEGLKNLAADLYNHIEAYINSTGRKIIVDNNTEEAMKEAVINWSTFLERAWSTDSVTVFVPCREWDVVPDGNVT